MTLALNKTTPNGIRDQAKLYRRFFALRWSLKRNNCNRLAQIAQQEPLRSSRVLECQRGSAIALPLTSVAQP